MSHKKYLYGLSALALAVSAVNAFAWTANPTYRPQSQHTQLMDKGGSEGVASAASPVVLPTSTTGTVATGAYTSVYITGFEAADGWDLANSICGLSFAFPGVCSYPVSGANLCVPKDNVTSQNCCDLNPNEDTGWFMNISNRHCREPHIDIVNPKSGAQHLRFQYDPLGGVPAGCQTSSGFAAACRQRINTPYDQNQGEISKTTYAYEIAFNKASGMLTRIRDFVGMDLGANNGIYTNAYAYWLSSGKLYVFSDAGYAAPTRQPHILAYFLYDVPNYAKLSIELDPCNNLITYTYTGVPVCIPACTPPDCPPGCNPFGTATGVSTYTTYFDFSPPYGDFNFNSGADNSFPVVNSSVWSQSHRLDGTTVDLDNYVIAHEPCADACCNGNLGTCTEGLTQQECTGPGMHYYPNVQCSQLGMGRCSPPYPGFPGPTTGSSALMNCLTDADCLQGIPPADPPSVCELGWYPPSCSKDRGSCCDAGPGSGGTCTPNVVETNCLPPQKTWVRGGSCTAVDVTGLCHVGRGVCSGDSSAIVDRPSMCLNQPNFPPCTKDEECFVQGFCWAGQCAPAATPGTCVYSTLGYCQTMGRCSTSKWCEGNNDTWYNPCTDIPDECGLGGECVGQRCDDNCGTTDSPPTCPLGAGEVCAGAVGCDVVPSGADCEFCEGCDGFPQVGCSDDTDCPPPFPGLPGGTCVPNQPIGCNVNGQCPSERKPCIIPPINPQGRLCEANKCVGGVDDGLNCIIDEDPAVPLPCPGGLCVSNGQCDIHIPAPTCEPEHRGACCHGTTGVCNNDVLSADCTGDQVVWTKLGVCAALDPPCVQHTGACCDANPKAVHCTDGIYPQDCDGPNQNWFKGTLCAVAQCPAVVLGACCNTLAGTCEDNKLAADCSGPQRVFSLDKTCANVTCDAVLGACCDHDTFGGCTNLTSAECVPVPGENKLEWTKGAACANITTCDHVAIPTVSQWGLVVLTLLLLVGAKVYFGRRQSAAA